MTAKHMIWADSLLESFWKKKFSQHDLQVIKKNILKGIMISFA